MQRWTFLAERLCGLVLVVPLMEELFWRSFLLRYATRADFTSLAMGQFSAGAFWTVVAISAAAHREWLAAAIASALFTWLLRHTRNLFIVIVAHAAANASAATSWLRVNDSSGRGRHQPKQMSLTARLGARARGW